ncbi:hypothetical protein [Streptomyces antimycoticus]|uniref:hypothetical protein n=1 Tax=Streptomyces antimycoticus TaxID=68175 RepID=UPI000A3BD1EE|nr:hypothetical protein [Streptomyces antimycoticus]
MSAFTVAAVVASLDGADWLPPTAHWEIATTDGVWGAHCEIAAGTEAEASRILRAIAEARGSEVADDSRLVTVDFVYDEVPVRAWWLRPVKRWLVPEQCATCPTKLGGPGVSFVRLGAGREAPVVCVPCRDRMHRRWVGGDAARDAEVLSEAAEAADCLTREDSPNITTTLESAWYDGADAAVQLLHRMADEAGKVTQPADFFQPGRTYAYGQTGYRAPELTVLFWVEHVTRHPERGHLRAIGWSKTGEPGAKWQGYFQDEDQFEGWAAIAGDSDAVQGKPAQPAELTIYRASHESIVMGLYTTPAEARAHCVAEERRTWARSAAPVFDWIEDEEDGVAELVTVDEDGETETITGYVVTALTVASEYDAEADE